MEKLKNENESKRLHYMNVNVGFLKGSTRFEIGYGKKREGIFCVGGVCKLVPSSNGLNKLRHTYYLNPSHLHFHFRELMYFGSNQYCNFQDR